MSRTNTQRLVRRSRPWPVLCIALLVAACSSSERPLPDLSTPGAAQMPAPRVGNDVHSQAVRGLVSPDFEVRTRAARELVAAGDAAVPALGRAGDLRVPVAGGMEVSATRSVVQSILAQSEPAAIERHLGSPWPNVRRSAAEELGRRDAWGAIPRLIERLDDPDADVRDASAISLRRLTNHFLGYQPQASLGERREAADRWRTWWSQEGTARMRERELGPSAAVDTR